VKRWIYVAAAVAVAAGAWWWWKRRKAAAAAPAGASPAAMREKAITPPRPTVMGVPLINYAAEPVGKAVSSVVETVTDQGDDGLFRGA
jgi:hypothetical protein